MISRRTVLALAEVYMHEFSGKSNSSSAYGGSRINYSTKPNRLYDFLYTHDYPAWFCNLAKKSTFGHSSEFSYATRDLKEFIMKLHTGETQTTATPDWTWEQRERLGQQYLVNLSEDILNDWHNEQSDWAKKKTVTQIEKLLRNLELDGYIYKQPQLLTPESDVLDVKEEAGVLETLFNELSLNNRETTFHHLKLSEEHYIAKRWDDSVANSRKFFECILREVASAYSLKHKGTPLSDSSFKRPVEIRNYLEREGLLENKEKETIASVYGLLSETGGHPYMAKNEQARLLRHLALTFSQFVMLRLKGSS